MALTADMRGPRPTPPARAPALVLAQLPQPWKLAATTLPT